MAILHTAGTQFEKAPPKALDKPMLVMVALLLLHSAFAPNFELADIKQLSNTLLLSLNEISWIILCCCIALGLYSMSQRLKYHHSPLYWLWLVIAVLITLPVIYHHEQSWIPFRLIAIWLSLLFIFVMQQTLNGKTYVNQVLFISFVAIIGLIFQGYVIYFFFTDSEFSQQYSHLDYIGSLSSVCLALAAYLHARSSHRPWWSFLASFAPMAIVPMLFISNSLIGWISLLFTAPLLNLYLYKNLSFNQWLTYFFSYIIGIGLGMIIAVSGDDFWLTLFDSSILSQASLLMQLKDMIIENPIWGYGYGQFESAYILYSAYQHYYDTSYPLGIPALTHPNNEVLYWWIEGGLFAVLALFLVTISILYPLTKLAKSHACLILAIFLPILLQSLFKSPFYQFNFYWFVSLVLLFWFSQIVSTSSRTYQLPVKAQKIFKTSALILLAVSLFALVTSFQFYQQARDLTLQRSINTTWLPLYPNHWRQSLKQIEIESMLAQKSAKELDQQGVKLYLDWQFLQAKRHPRPENYQKLIKLYQDLGMIKEQQVIKNEADFLFHPQKNDTIIKYSD